MSKLILRKELQNDKMFYEKVLYKLGKELNIPTSGSYKDVYIHALEKILKKQKIDECVIHNYREVVKSIEDVKGSKLIKASAILLESLK